MRRLSRRSFIGTAIAGLFANAARAWGEPPPWAHKKPKPAVVFPATVAAVALVPSPSLGSMLLWPSYAEAY